jgi:hypothetical protein
MPSRYPTRDVVLEPSRVALVDALMDLYVSWRERADDVGARYTAWARARSSDERTAAFAAYAGALDQEAHAAHRFGEFAGYAGTVLSA